MPKRSRNPIPAISSEPWFVRRPARELPFSFFVSHVTEDADDVALLKSEINVYSGRAGRGGKRALDCFLDIHNWPTAKLSSAAIREKLLESAHFVFWVTPAYLKNQRGWVWMELAYAELIELSANLGTMDHRPYIVPIFRKVSVQDIEGTPLLGYWQGDLGRLDLEIKEIAKRLVDFYDQEAPKRNLT
jgi:hypothetical protein